MVGKVCGVTGCLCAGNQVSSGSSRVAERRRAQKVVARRIAKVSGWGVLARICLFQATRCPKMFCRGMRWGCCSAFEKQCLQLMCTVG